MWQQFHGCDTKSTGKKEQERNDFIKIKTFCASRKSETAYRAKESIHKPDVGLAFRICKELLQLKNKPPD